MLKTCCSTLLVLLLSSPMLAMQKLKHSLSAQEVQHLLKKIQTDCDTIILKDGRVILGRIIESGAKTVTIAYCEEDKAEVLNRNQVSRIGYSPTGKNGSIYNRQQYSKLIGWGLGLMLGSLLLAYPVLALVIAVSFGGGPELLAIFLTFLILLAFIAGFILLIAGLIMKFNRKQTWV